MDIPLDMQSDLAASFREYTVGELQDAAAALLVMCAESKGMEYAALLDKTHQVLSSNACKRATETAKTRGEAFFFLLATGIDMTITAIAAIEKTAFMAEVDEIGMEEG